MIKINSFEQNVKKYDEWYVKHKNVYGLELQAIQNLLPHKGTGIEIGVGTGRFASELGIKIGVEPSIEMGKIAKERGVEIIRGTAEAIPLFDYIFDYAIMVTTICFLDDILKSFIEVYRILKPNGVFLVGFIDKNSLIGKIYQKKNENNIFYKDARFFSSEEVEKHLEKTGFNNIEFYQTLIKEPKKFNEIEPIKKGHDRGSFIIAKGYKKS